MNEGKAFGPFGIVVETIWATIDMGASMIHDLAASIISDGKVQGSILALANLLNVLQFLFQKQWRYFFYFSEKIGYDITCKLSP